jgi:hypothetical protein
VLLERFTLPLFRSRHRKENHQMLKRAPIFACLIALVVASAAFAGPNKSSSSISLVQPLAATTTSSYPSYGQTVTFAVATTATTQPFVHLRCSQNGSLVLESWQGFSATALGSQQFNLGPTPAWTRGAASCTATLENWDSYSKNGKTTALASTSFDVSG